MSGKVIAAGHICLDITPVFPAKNTASPAELLQPGKLVETHGVTVSTGGSVANTGLAMKLLGCDVSLMGKIGCDSFGDMICSLLEKHGAGDGMLRVDGEATSYSVVLALPGVDRIFLHDAGANNTFCADDVPEDALKDAALFHFGYPPIMRRMYSDGGTELVSLFRKAKAEGCATSMDMAAVAEGSEAAAADWDGILKSVIPFVDFFLPSAEELCFMLDRERFAEWQSRAKGGDVTETLDVDRDIRPLADRCMEYGAGVLVIKCGAAGVYCRTADGARMSFLRRLSDSDGFVSAWSGFERFERSFHPEKILSASGAGDTGIAAFLTAAMNGYDPERALRLMAAEGACCVEAYDSLSGLLTLDGLEQRIASGWEKN